MTAAVQTLWAELIAASLVDAGVATCVVSPGSRSTPLVAALANERRLELVPIIDERSAAFFALGVARATGVPAAIVCTSGSAAAHYLPAIVEASTAAIPLVVVTADRPPELQNCGATQTIDQIKLYGTFVRGAFDLGAPVGSESALRAVRRTVIRAVVLARGPHAGPIQLEVPLRKPLEPAAPSTDGERALARVSAELRAQRVVAAPPTLVADSAAIDELAIAIANEPRGVIVAGAMPLGFARARSAMFELAARAGYPILAEAGSQLKLAARGRAVVVARADFAMAAGARPPRLVIELGAEPVAAARPSFAGAARWVLSDHEWRDPDGSARGVIVGDVGATIVALAGRLDGGGLSPAGSAAAWRRGSLEPRGGELAASWREVDDRCAVAVDAALAAHPRSETAVMRAAVEALPAGAIIQIGNSLPIRVVDHAIGHGPAHGVITQRGAAGIDGLISSAAGATRAGAPVLLVLGDVSFAHDLGGLLAARAASAPLAILVLDNAGGQIFAGLPIASAGLDSVVERYFVTAPQLDPVAVAVALGARAITAGSAASAAAAVATALASPGVTVIHAPVTATGAHDVRRYVLDLLAAPTRASAGVAHV